MNKDAKLLAEAYGQVNDTPVMAYMGDYRNVVPLADIEGFLKRIESDINRGVEYISAFVKREEPSDRNYVVLYFEAKGRL